MACSNVLGSANINLTFGLGRLDGIYLVLVWFTALLVTISQISSSSLSFTLKLSAAGSSGFKACLSLLYHRPSRRILQARMAEESKGGRRCILISFCNTDVQLDSTDWCNRWQWFVSLGQPYIHVKSNICLYQHAVLITACSKHVNPETVRISRIV